MAITHSTAVRNAATDAVVDLIDVGGAGTLEILDDAVVLAILTFSATAFGASAAGVATAAAITPDASANATGTADKFKIKDGNSLEIMNGQVGQKRAIADIADGAGGIVDVVGDHTAEFAAGTDFTIVGSTGNDGSYTVASVNFDDPNTAITIEADQTLPSAVVDGYVHVGQIGLDNTSIAETQNVAVSSLTYCALPT